MPVRSRSRSSIAAMRCRPVDDKLAHLIQILIHALANRAAIRKRHRWLVHQRARDQLVAGRPAYRAPPPSSAQRLAGFAVTNSPTAARRPGKPRQRLAQRHHLARPGRLQRDAPQQPLQVEHPIHRPPQALPPAKVAHRLRHRIQPRVDRVQRLHRPQQLRAQQPLAHRRAARVERPEQRRLRTLAREQRLHQLQVPHAHRIQLQRVVALVVPQRVQMLQRPLLGRAQVMHNRPRSHRSRVMLRPAPCRPASARCSCCRSSGTA